MKTNAPATVAEALLRHGVAFLKKHPPGLDVYNLLNLLPLCRTRALGGHLYRCSECGHEQPRYDSCGNRHCPNCQVKAREAWLARQEADLLEVPYFHLVFTLPEELQPLLLQNKKAGYNLLFGCSADTLLTFGKDPHHGLEGQLGFTFVLHTWNQTLGLHAHLHVLVPAGALSLEKTRFKKVSNPNWLFPVKALSKVFRAMFLKRLKEAHAKGKLAFHGPLTRLRDSEVLATHLQPLYEKDWVVYAKRPFGGPQQVLAYLGRYTHRIAISNFRVLEVTDKHVFFSYRDRKQAAQTKVMRLDGAEFLRRFFLHVLPKGFTRIRHYGFLGNAVRKTHLLLIGDLMGQSHPKPIEEAPIERIARIYHIDLNACPHCRTGRLQLMLELSRPHCKDPPL